MDLQLTPGRGIACGRIVEHRDDLRLALGPVQDLVARQLMHPHHLEGKALSVALDEEDLATVCWEIVGVLVQSIRSCRIRGSRNSCVRHLRYSHTRGRNPVDGS